MVRPWDQSYRFEGRFHARPEHAPVGWVGDQRRDWIGLEDALDHIFRSAAAGYGVLGSDVGGRWHDWWNPGADVLDGDRTLSAYSVPERERVPLFVREGAIVPANVKSAVTGLGSTARASALTVLVWPAVDERQFVLVDEDDASTTISASTSFVQMSRALRPTYVRIRRETAPTSVEITGAAVAASADDVTLEAAPRGWRYDAAKRWL